MFEHFVIGFLVGILSMLPVFPDGRNFWGWVFKRFRSED
jgi:hypothetical protein